jgi:2-polyprenyl-3-methyl-5-hydroxy-6-metoxy-1,4-benzoquinol methylase
MLHAMSSPSALCDYYRHMRVDILQRVPFGARRLLDVGCGGGATAAAAKSQRGAEFVVGIEANGDAAEAARAVLDQVIEGRAQDSLQGLGEPFDVVICADILEHLEDPWGFLKALRHHIAPNGCVVASIPNIGHGRVVLDILRDRFAYSDEGILDRTHLRFFTQATIVDMFESTGYTVTSIDMRQPDNASRRLMARVAPNALKRLTAMQYFVVAEPTDK